MMLKVLLTLRAAGYSFPLCSSRPSLQWRSLCSTGYCCRCFPTSWCIHPYTHSWCGCCTKGRQDLWSTELIRIWTLCKTDKSDTGLSTNLFIFSSSLLRMIGDIVTWIINQSNVLKPKVLEVSFKAKDINYLVACGPIAHNIHAIQYISKSY